MSLGPNFSVNAKATMSNVAAQVHFIIDVTGYFQ
jgi:hypothetical protein